MLRHFHNYNKPLKKSDLPNSITQLYINGYVFPISLETLTIIIYIKTNDINLPYECKLIYC